MTLLQNDPITQLAFSLYENKGVFAVLLGSGLSRSAEIPTGWEITLDLVRRVAEARGLDIATVRHLVDSLTQKPWLGLFGTEKVNVLRLNVALEELNEN